MLIKSNATATVMQFINLKYGILFTVALQFPEGLLMFACTIADIIEK